MDACPELWMPGTERAAMALGLVIVSPRADLLIVIPRACTSLVAGDAASPLARAIVDIGAACARRWVRERRGGGARVGVTPVVPGRCATACVFSRIRRAVTFVVA